jgi:hypothetical protein
LFFGYEAGIISGLPEHMTFDSFAFIVPCFNRISDLRFIFLLLEISFGSHESSNTLKGIFYPQSRTSYLLA